MVYRKYINKFLKYAAGGAAAGFAGRQVLGKRKRSQVKFNTKKRTRKPTKPTRTFTFRKKQNNIVRSPPTGISHSSIYVAYKPSKDCASVKRLQAPFTYEKLESFSTTHEPSVQSIIVLPIFAQAITNTLFQQSTVTRDGLGSLLSSPQVQALAQSTKVLLNTSHTIHAITNASMAAAVFDIYDVVSKVTSRTLIAPDLSWQEGLDDQEQSTSNTLSNTFMYSVPTTSKQFNMAWKIVKRTRIEMGPARTHEHIVTFKPQRIVDTNYNSEYAQIKGITMYTMVVVRGVPTDNATTQAVGGLIGSTEGKVVGLTRQKYSVYGCSIGQRHGIQLNTAATAAFVPIVYNEGDGANVAQEFI